MGLQACQVHEVSGSALVSSSLGSPRQCFRQGIARLIRSSSYAHTNKERDESHQVAAQMLGVRQ
eukprot:19748-Heterococcus_DN1.PRE.1